MAIVNLLVIPFSNQAFFGYTWGQVLNGIFIISAFSVLIQMEMENKHFRDNRPSIKIKPFVQDHYRSKLEIYNYGAKATFSVKGKIITSDLIKQSQLYEMCWDVKDGVIYNKDTGIILVAEKCYPMNHTEICVKIFYKGITPGSIEFEHFMVGYWNKDENHIIKKDIPPQSTMLEITITSEPPLRKPFSKLIFELSQPNITNLELKYIRSGTRKLKIDKEGYLS